MFSAIYTYRVPVMNIVKTHNVQPNLNGKVQSIKWTEKKSFCACIKHFTYKNVLNKKTLTSRKQF